MSSINKSSLREEFDSLKAQFKSLSNDGKVTAESRALFQAMLMLFEVLMVVFMEKSTRKCNRNSSIPSSQTCPDDSATGQPGGKGKGPTQNNQHSAHSRTVETTEVVQAYQCGHCSKDISDIPCEQHERRTQIDIIFEKVVNHVDAEIKLCPYCEKRTKARFPVKLSGPLQYGPGIKAFVLNLLIAQMVSLNRIQKSMQTLIGQTISQATILKYAMQLHLALALWEREATERLLAMPPCMLTRPHCGSIKRITGFMSTRQVTSR